jgi:hypothetical protein
LKPTYYRDGQEVFLGACREGLGRLGSKQKAQEDGEAEKHPGDANGRGQHLCLVKGLTKIGDQNKEAHPHHTMQNEPEASGENYELTVDKGDGAC